MPGGGAGQQPAVRPDDRPGLQLQVPPPGHVGGVAERADHGQAGALGRVGQPVRQDRHADAEQRRPRHAAEQRRVPLVVRVRDQRHAGRQQLGPGGGNDQLALARQAGVEPERQPVVRAWHLPVLELGLGHRGAEGHVPERRPLRLVGLAPGQVAQERALRDGLDPVIDGAVTGVPVHGQAQLAPDLRVGTLVLPGELPAQLDEVAPGDGLLAGRRGRPAVLRRTGEHQPWVVGQRRIAAHPVVDLHAPLRRQAVVVPPDRDRRLPGRAFARSGRACRSGCRRRRARCARTRWPSAAACRWRRRHRGGRSGQTCTTRSCSQRRAHLSSRPSSVGLAGAERGGSWLLIPLRIAPAGAAGQAASRGASGRLVGWNAWRCE